MPTPSDRRSMHLDPRILDFLKMPEAQGRAPLWTLSPVAAGEGICGTRDSCSGYRYPARGLCA